MKLQMFDENTGSPADMLDIPDKVMDAVLLVSSWLREHPGASLMGLKLPTGIFDELCERRRDSQIRGERFQVSVGSAWGWPIVVLSGSGETCREGGKSHEKDG